MPIAGFNLIGRRPISLQDPQEKGRGLKRDVCSVWHLLACVTAIHFCFVEIQSWFRIIIEPARVPYAITVKTQYVGVLSFSCRSILDWLHTIFESCLSKFMGDMPLCKIVHGLDDFFFCKNPQRFRFLFQHVDYFDSICSAVVEAIYSWVWISFAATSILVFHSV